MNDSERTPSKEAKLKLKGFHKRQIITRTIKNLFNFKAEKPDLMHGSGSGGNKNIKSSFTYILEEIKAIDRTYANYYRKRFRHTFNKSQLIDKIILIYNKQYRIISK